MIKNLRITFWNPGVGLVKFLRHSLGQQELDWKELDKESDQQGIRQRDSSARLVTEKDSAYNIYGLVIMQPLVL